MAEFEFNCPQCGLTIEADESLCGQVAECPHCGKGIVVPSNKANTKVQQSNLSTSGRIKIVDQEERYQKKKPKNVGRVQSKPQDVQFFLPGILQVLYWFFVILHLIGCMILSIYFFREGSLWYCLGIIIIAFPLGLFNIRIWYELQILIFGGVRHLREIRDELRRQGKSKLQDRVES